MLSKFISEHFDDVSFIPHIFRSTSLFFGDIVGFTNLTAMSTARETIEFLNDLYLTFDTAIERYDVYKV